MAQYIYADTFGRTNSATTPGTSEIGNYAYENVGTYTALGISSNALYNPNATASTAYWECSREFDITFTPGAVGTVASQNYFYFGFAGDATLLNALYVVVASNYVQIGQLSSGTPIALTALTATTISSATAVRIRVTKTKVDIWVAGTLTLSLDVDVYGNQTGCAWVFPFASSTNATIASAYMSPIGYATKTSSQLITRTRALLNETDSTNSNVTNAEMIEFFNQGLEELNNRLPMPVGQISYTGSQFTNYEVLLPADCFKVEEVRNQSVPVAGIRFQDRSYLTGIYRDVEERTAGYYVRDRVLGIPNLATTDTITVYYRRAAMEIDTDTGPEISQGFNNYLISYCLARCWEKIGDGEQASYYDGRAEKQLTAATESYVNRQVSIRQIQEVSF